MALLPMLATNAQTPRDAAKLDSLIKADSLAAMAAAAALDSVMIADKHFAYYKYYQHELDTNELYYYFYRDTLGQEVRITESIFEDAEGFREDYALVKLKGKYGFIDTLGKIVIPCEYDNASSFSEGISIVFSECKTALLYKDGKVTLLYKDYEYVNTFKENRSIVSIGGKFGAIDRNGNEVIKPQYEDLRPFSQGLAVATDSSTHKKGVVDSLGRMVYAMQYDYVSDFDRTKLAVFENEFETKKHRSYSLKGYGNTNGDIVVPIEFDRVDAYAPGYFSAKQEKDFLIVAYKLKKHGLAKVGRDSRFIRNKFLRKTYFFFRAVFSRKRYRKQGKKSLAGFLRTLESSSLYSNTGKLLLFDNKNIIAILDEEHAMTINKKEMRMVNIQGEKRTLPGLNIALPNKNNDDSRASDGYLLVQNKKKQLGMVDYNGNIELPAVYTKITATRSYRWPYYDQQYMCYRKDTIDVYNYIFKKELSIAGTKIRDIEIYTDSIYNLPEFTAREFNGIKMYFVKYNDKYAILDSMYRVLKPYEYDVLMLNNNRIIFSKNGKYGIMNYAFKNVVEPTYDKMSVSNYGSSDITITVNKKKGLIDNDGKVIVPPLYDNIERDSENSYWVDDSSHVHYKSTDYFVVKSNKKFGYLDSSAKVIMPLAYEKIFSSDNFLVVVKNKLRALYTRNGKQITNFKYASMYNANPNYSYYRKNNGNVFFLVKNKKFTGMIDSTGKETIPLIYSSLYSIDREGLYYAEQNDKAGVVDTNNKILLPLEYDDIDYLYNAKAFKIKQGTKYGIADINGKVIIPVQYNEINQWQDDLYRVRVNVGTDWKYGIVNNNGKVIIEANYDYDQIDYYRNTIILTAEGKKYFYNSQGETVNDCYLDKHIGNSNDMYDLIDY